MTRWSESWLELYDLHWDDLNIALLLGRTNDAWKVQIPVIKIILSGITFLAKYRRIVVCLHVTNNKIERYVSHVLRKKTPSRSIVQESPWIRFLSALPKEGLNVSTGTRRGYKELLYSNFPGWGSVDYL